RGLPGAVGADEAGHDTARDPEVEMVDGEAVAVPLRKPRPGGHRGIGRAAGSGRCGSGHGDSVRPTPARVVRRATTLATTPAGVRARTGRRRPPAGRGRAR